ncbi:hypothetical protein BU16DRAFT_62140 [Lophium mytilinum]|uniref:Uncharacterized protein n=1 Tax=Lophium mytilinum TaxID=390894 RepID=A0A6A6QNR9_9PEZI|nr:hypothetical protein BU16DRAFT_62140 [Lophium mytilinum]
MWPMTRQGERLYGFVLRSCGGLMLWALIYAVTAVLKAGVLDLPRRSTRSLPTEEKLGCSMTSIPAWWRAECAWCATRALCSRAVLVSICKVGRSSGRERPLLAVSADGMAVNRADCESHMPVAGAPGGSPRVWVSSRSVWWSKTGS